MTPSVTIVLPAYNAAGIVGDSVARLRAELPYDPLEIIVVDDGSRDRTAKEASQADLVIEFNRNKGKGAAVRAGILRANGEIVVFTDVDLSYGPEVIQEVVAAVQKGVKEKGVKVCVGQRKIDTGTAIRKAGSRLIKWCTRRLLSEDYDTQCGIKAFERSLAKQIFSVVGMNRFAFDIEIFFIMKSWGVRFETIDVVAEKREASTVRAMRDGFTTLRDSMRIARRSRRGIYRKDESL